MLGDTLTVDVLRGDRVESQHRVMAVIADATGVVRQAWGDADALVFARSAIKPIQALPLIETGAADRFGLGAQHLALACSSHMGEPAHAALVEAWLARVGLDVAALECGTHDPMAVEAAYDLVRAGVAPRTSHNNCSGKHTGFVTTAVHCGEPVAGYIAHAHPVQQRVLAALSDMSGFDYRSAPYGIDGCGIPTVAAPLASLATALARLDDPVGQPPARVAAARRIVEAMAAEPFFVSGTHGTATRTMQAAGGKTVVKTGAEGVYVASLRGRGLGIAVKTVDGTERGATLSILQLLDALGAIDPAAATALGDLMQPTLRNRAGTTVGALRLATDLEIRF
jgi:L-asparaginase II